jgi:hypothetical protein
MKTFMIASLTAGAFATQIPTISLDLSSNVEAYTGNHPKGANSFARRCQVQEDDASATAQATACPSPTATAHDHHAGDLSSSISYSATQFVTSAAGSLPVQTSTVLSDGIVNGGLASKYYKNRGEFVLSYNVQDASNNAAEELVFAMIMEDLVAPTIVIGDTRAADSTVQACMDTTGSTARCVASGFNTGASDTYDGTLTGAKLTYSVNDAAAANVEGATITVDVKTLGDNKITFTATDFADIFGTNNQNNVATKELTIKVEDTIAPRVYLSAADSTTSGLVTAEANVCGAELSGPTTIAACLEHNMKKVVPNFADSETECAGCKDNKCFAAGSNACTAVNALANETYECGVAGPTNLFDADGKAKASGAFGVDDRESAVGGASNENAVDTLSVTPTGTYDKLKIGTQTFTYTTSESRASGALSATVTRSVQVHDTTPVVLKITHLGHADLTRNDDNYKTHNGVTNPTGTLADPMADLHTIQHSAGYVKDAVYIAGLVKPGTGYSCTDTCANGGAGLTNVDFSNNLGSKAEWYKGAGCGLDGSTAVLKTRFETLTVGAWSLKYSCGDGYQVETACREIINEDHAKPIITILEGDKDTYQATKSDNYVDAGATCWDEVDDNISQDVEVSGDVVNLARVGTYQIFYNCKDSAGNEADPATRTVTVEDTTCPTCKFNDAADQELEIEASFAFTDNFGTDVTCTDELQESIVPVATTYSADGSVTTGDISQTIGTYTITYVATDSVGNTNTGAQNCKSKDTNGDLVVGGQAAAEYTRTVVVKDTLKPVIKLSLDGADIKTGSSGTSAAADFKSRHNPESGSSSGHASPKTWLMAEEASTTAVNGWVMGAVASAVSGLALLGYSLRKQAQPVATSVPV